MKSEFYIKCKNSAGQWFYWNYIGWSPNPNEKHLMPQASARAEALHLLKTNDWIYGFEIRAIGEDLK